MYSDEDATYAARHTIDLSTLEPIIVIPPSPANTRDLKDYLDLPVQVGYLGLLRLGPDRGPARRRQRAARAQGRFHASR